MKQFDKHADAYHAVRGKVAYPDIVYETLVRRAPGREAALDIGCGNGVSTYRLQPLFDYVEGSDLGASLIDKARQTYPGITFGVSPAEDYTSTRQFDAVTSATSFYWMDRDAVLRKMETLLKPGGVFCAYKYDFPIAYGPLRDFCERELSLKWAAYRDARLTRYDDTLERIKASKIFREAERVVLSNIIELTPREVATFFLSTSYVKKYMDQADDAEYADELLRKVAEIETAPSVKVNFDIHSFFAKR
ncbi:class I SAM-dependent methyltransferase [Verminephrobacter aporrectodeae]|uniref:class I SAM-dependent methyltransferase n=1 Tax=Verminephrobacter aporrectodeae TaxID=1110389 RepID=UPI0022440445|nr:class I SAM-dependent methyltransferase [Verminephrobacter aporrectodeae]MCW8176057.1 class I SAM-dependent methyltransferase [Verminephrobacter aporrectodeae subsp. tuberculatae]MCW8203664.1 class I SAM-dependent methyltransferase [Verminephrobacter aporrectodeae subsp. tuberculatae]